MHLDPRRLIHLIPLLLLGIALLMLVPRLLRRETEPPADAPVTEKGPRYAGSAACRPCHEGIWSAWATSHHARAEREFDPVADGAAFTGAAGGPLLVRHGSIETRFRERGGAHEFLTTGPGGRRETYRPVRVIGVDPLWQLVVPAPKGRYQVTSLAYDPARAEWFDVYGDEDRQPHEWGFWTGRGMTWNTMCGTCHTTRFEKGYSSETDSFDSEFLELGVGCEACHGARGDHVELARAAEAKGDEGPLEDHWAIADFELPPDPSTVDLSEEELRFPGLIFDPDLDACGACHARRSDLTGAFRPGERFEDHYRLAIPDLTEGFYADGQVRDEDFEYTSFLSSRMYTLGVRCLHCHDPHTAKTKKSGNALCLSCHEGRVDPAHSYHDPSGPGHQCINCHMPITNYMQRHPRHDHGFTIPDPLLTKEHGIPNACNRCHRDKSADWALEAVERLYGSRMNRATRRRARILARARDLDPRSVGGLLELLRREPAPLWKSTAILHAAPWVTSDDRLPPRLRELLGSKHALVRASAARALEPIASSLAGPAALADPIVGRVARALLPLLEDPVRLVRLEAAWALRRLPDGDDTGAVPGAKQGFLVDEDRRAGRELEHYLQLSSDQPTGLVQRAVLALGRGRAREGVAWLKRAAEWDGGSAEVRRRLALALISTGDLRGARRRLQEAFELDRKNPQIAFDLGLLLQETGSPVEAEEKLVLACRLDDRFSDAWYHLALLRAELDRPREALEAVRRAEELDGDNPLVLEARAGIHHALGEDDLAREYLERAQRAREAMIERLTR